MNILARVTDDTALQEGILGCIIAAICANGYPSPEDYDRMIDSVAGRTVFLNADIIGLIKGQMAMQYVLEEEFLKTSCEKITDEWKRPVFTIACHLILDSRITPKSIRFLKALKEELQIDNVNDIVEVMQWLHKSKHRTKLCNI